MKKDIKYSKIPHAIRGGLLLVLCFLSTYTIAQDKKLSFGGKIGLAVSNFTNEQPHTGSRVGYQLGGFVKYNVLPMLDVELDVLYQQQGGTKLSIENMPPGLNTLITRRTTTHNYALHYIDIPVLARLDVSQLLGWDMEFKPKVIAGPALGILMRGYDRYDRTMELSSASFPTVNDPILGSVPLRVTSTDQEDVTGNFERLNFGIYMGIGGEVPIGLNMTLMLDLTYRLGISPADTEDANRFNIVSSADDIRTNVISFTIGVGF
ncbi:hypothetical protein BKI52_30945 [marine bacterium AO1-C]|nr:hypothetical protein BKI52_30945 [marine bacterium AO1-C]